jgi:hypothetical protein
METNNCQTMDIRSFQIVSMNINDFRNKIDEQVKIICTKYPEVNPDEIDIVGQIDTMCCGDYEDEIAMLTFKFRRNLTEHEIEMRKFQHEHIKKRSIENMQKLMKDNIEEAIIYLKELDFEISHKPKTKIDCAKGLIAMFCDENDNFTELSKDRHKYMKENEK